MEYISNSLLGILYFTGVVNNLAAKSTVSFVEITDKNLAIINNNLGNGFQLVLNLLNQKALPLINKAHEKGYGIIARMALQFGLLTGKFDNGVSFAANDHRKSRLTKEVIESANTALVPVWGLCEK